MKKRLLILLCTVFVFIFGGICAHAENQFTLTATLAEGTEVPEGGIKMALYIGSVVDMRAHNAACYEYSVMESDDTWKSTSWTDINHFDLHQRQEVTFMPGEKKKSVNLPIGYTLGTDRCVAYEVLTDSYIGTGGKYISDDDTEAEIEVSAIKGVTLSGTITLPEKVQKDMAYGIEVTGNGNDEIYYDRSFHSGDIISEGSESIDYSIIVRPGMDYTVSATFEREYTTQTKDIHINGDNANLNFEPSPAKKISVTVKCPDEVEFKNMFDDDIEELPVNVTLQNADEPHEHIDIGSVSLAKNDRTAQVELYNVTDAENVIVYYSMPWPYDSYPQVAKGGAYLNDIKSAACVNDATVLTGDNHEITLNLIPANLVTVDVKNGGENVKTIGDGVFLGDVFVIIPDENGEEYFRIEKKLINGMDYFNIPKEYENYILAVSPVGGTNQIYRYYSQNGFTEDIHEADLVSVSDAEFSPEYGGYTSGTPIVACVDKTMERETDLYHLVWVDMFNSTNAPIDTAIILAFYDENDCLTDVKISDQTVETDYLKHFYVDKNLYASSKTVKAFIWDKMTPLCEQLAVK